MSTLIRPKLGLSAENVEAKLANPSFLGDVEPLVPVNLKYDVRVAADQVHEELISLL